MRLNISVLFDQSNKINHITGLFYKNSLVFIDFMQYNVLRSNYSGKGSISEMVHPYLAYLGRKFALLSDGLCCIFLGGKGQPYYKIKG